MQKTLIIALIVVVVILAGVLIWQNLPKPASVVEQTSVVNNQPVANQPSTNCVKEDEVIKEDYIGKYGSIPSGVCCSGLTPIKDSASSKPLVEGGCSGVGSDSYACTACGNGVCGKGENQCNCPADCKAKLTMDVLKNIEYCPYIDFGGKCIKLVNGIYQTKPSSIEYTKIEDNYTAYGDLNNDGQEDATIVIVEYGGGTGFFRTLVAVLNQNGKAFVVAMQYLGDRTAINSITITSGIITIDMTPWGGGTGVRKVVQYKLSGDKLIEVN
ncbi:MAG: hypothetical protein PHY72_03925 [Candidatus Pacebacteria bacterium]|nr:hypothetical protein [Candidatus Paceibacterota bacterium]